MLQGNANREFVRGGLLVRRAKLLLACSVLACAMVAGVLLPETGWAEPVGNVSGVFRAVSGSPKKTSPGKNTKGSSSKNRSKSKKTITRKVITGFRMTHTSTAYGDSVSSVRMKASYDKAGRLSHKEVLYDQNSFGMLVPYYSLDYTYDTKGHLAGIECLQGQSVESAYAQSWEVAASADGTSLDASAEEQYGDRPLELHDSYDKAGNLQKRASVLRVGTPLQDEAFALTYDKSGKIVKQAVRSGMVVGYFEDSSQYSEYNSRLSYDKKGRLASIEVEDQFGSLYSSYTYGYDKAGHMTQRTRLRVLPQASSDVREQSFTYKKGKLVSASMEDSVRGEAHAVFTTDKDGSIVSATIDGLDYTITYEIEYAKVKTAAGTLPQDGVDLSDLFDPNVYNELWIMPASGVYPATFGEADFLRANRSWLELKA